MDYIRIPVSLKFEKDDFFHDFVEPIKNDRGLSTLIVGLLRLYYENTTVKAEYEEFIKLTDPLFRIKQQLDRMVLEHSKSMMAAEALEEVIESKKDKSMDTIIDRLNNLESVMAIMPKLQKDIENLVSGLQVGVAIKNEDIKLTSEVALVVEKVSEESEGGVSRDDGFKSSVGVGVEFRDRFGDGSGVEFGVNSGVFLSQGEEKIIEEEDKPKNPASFAKLLGSVKK